MVSQEPFPPKEAPGVSGTATSKLVAAKIKSILKC